MTMPEPLASTASMSLWRVPLKGEHPIAWRPVQQNWWRNQKNTYPEETDSFRFIQNIIHQTEKYLDIR
jgi:hypothetical protein